ncbi:MAG: hypothetical protein JWO30_3453 [Fibrobacteres bacterium]|nr:hypothetical protein [Fibrobacterota bacterium]
MFRLRTKRPNQRPPPKNKRSTHIRPTASMARRSLVNRSVPLLARAWQFGESLDSNFLRNLHGWTSLVSQLVLIARCGHSFRGYSAHSSPVLAYQGCRENPLRHGANVVNNYFHAKQIPRLPPKKILEINHKIGMGKLNSDGYRPCAASGFFNTYRLRHHAKWCCFCSKLLVSSLKKSR